MKRLIMSSALAGLLIAACGPACADDAGRIPIQHAGRVKSFESFARQSLELITGRGRWNRKPPVQTLLEAAADPEAAAQWQWIRVDYRPLVASLELPVPARQDSDGGDRHYYSYHEVLSQAGRLERIVRDAEAKRDNDQAPTLLERKAEALYGAMIAAQQIIEGRAFRVLPPPEGKTVWESPFESLNPKAAEFKALAKTAAGKDKALLESSTRAWLEYAHGQTRGAYRRTVDLEVLYLGSRPFEWSWILYLAAFLFAIGAGRRPAFRVPFAAAAACAFGAHTAGLALRTLILGRPPVSNMYESIVFMNWVVMLTALIFSAVSRNRVPAMIGAVVSAVIMIYGDLLPIDSGLDVLVPVLRSNYWLMIHVLTIVASYGIFGLAMGMGHRHLLLLRMRGRWPKKEQEQSAALIYRSIQVGMLLLGIGTVLGGVWANESWGRFWGWDPKETWALITFLGYAVIIHLHHAKLIDDFWLAMNAILGFLLVLMTWYGVNFVLGKGLHSYGQGSGGVNWVIAYLAAEALFLGWAFWSRPGKPSR